MKPRPISQHVKLIRQDVTRATLAPKRKPAVILEASASKERHQKTKAS
jgi:hypothetical protein